ncbi:MAG: hypothetical protein PHZ28_02460 [Candidatus Izemoplasmatales bacterium]|nr:hypothetical protein [Candidatus Izemoplasmatales bacterium]
MNNPLAKKIIIIGSVVLAVVIGALVLSLTVGKKTIPNLKDPKGIFYERLDDQGNVIYTITNEEIYEQIKGNNGVQQLMMMVDAELLKGYFDDITEAEIADKLQKLTYGTDDDDAIAEMDLEEKQNKEDEFARSMVLAGYAGNEDEYVTLIIAREKYAYESLLAKLTETEVAAAFISSYFEDMKAINIRFTSQEDAKAVLEKYHLAEIYGNTLALYRGYAYNSETLKDINGDIVEAYQSVTVYYFDESDNISDINKQVVYTLGTNGFYTDKDSKSYSLDNEGNLQNDVPAIVIEADLIFDDYDTAKAFKDANTTYYTMSRTDAFDKEEDVLIKDLDGNLVYTLKSDNKVYDTEDVDVTTTAKLIFNKNYKEQKHVSTFTPNNTDELSEQEILNYYILMYNYVYGEYRDLLPEAATKTELTSLDNENLMFNFDDVSGKSASLATYIFKTVSQINSKTYSSKPQSIAVSQETFYYMTYKLEEPTKLNLGKQVLDLIEQDIVNQVPKTVVENIELPTTGEYNATITWVSSNKEVIANDGKVTPPAVNSIVDLSYTIKVLGETRIGKITISVLTDGDNIKDLDLEVQYPSLKTLINNQEIYDAVSAKLIETKVYGSTGSTNINKELATLRTENGLVIYDYYLAKDYRELDSTYDKENNGNKTLVASLEKTLDSEEAFEISADDLYAYTLGKSPAIYTLQAAQFKEVLYSSFYEESFGTERNIQKNDSLRMDEIHAVVANSKSYYIYMKNMYGQYGMTYPYNSFLDYAYSQYGTKTETELMQYFIVSELRPYYINSVIDEENVVQALYSIVEDNFNNYFSLDVTQILIYLDYDEDGKPDNYKDYVATLTPEENTAFLSQLATLETKINDFEGDFKALVTAYKKATREDATWGSFKQAGILLLTEELNMPDEEDQEVTHSLHYSGKYGVKDSYDPDFTSALTSLYEEYRLPQNLELAELKSDLVVTQFGLHLILAKKGENFEQFSAKYLSTTEGADAFDSASYNENDLPTIEQLELYATYKFYSLVYDLSNADVEVKYGITVPKIPASVTKALDFYFEDVINQVYVLGTANIEIARSMANGNFLGNDLIDWETSAIMDNLQTIEDAYYGAVLSKYFE